MDFMSSMQNAANKTKILTDNGATAYATTGKALLDFNFKLSSYRTADVDDIMRDFAKAYYDDPVLAIKYLFWMRDVRGGAGERKAFRACLVWLANNKPEICKTIINLVPEYGRWDDLWVLLDTELKKDVIALIKYQMSFDLEIIKKDLGGSNEVI